MRKRRHLLQFFSLRSGETSKGMAREGGESCLVPLPGRVSGPVSRLYVSKGERFLSVSSVFLSLSLFLNKWRLCLR